MYIKEIWRYPVKSMAGESLQAATLTAWCGGRSDCSVRNARGRIETRTAKALACLRFFPFIPLPVNPLRTDRILANHNRLYPRSSSLDNGILWARERRSASTPRRSLVYDPGATFRVPGGFF
jgi:hypothetical protein